MNEITTFDLDKVFRESMRLRTLIREAVYEATLATHSADMDEVRRILEKLRDEADK